VRLEVAAGPEEVRLAVADSGPGLDAEQQARVFDRFWRADPSRAQATGGAGLGLAIARQLVLLHGGRITVASAPGAGARFTIHLPRVG
jgi:signal transduction histidine kinase